MCSNYQPIKRSNNPWMRQHFNVDLPDADWKPHTWPKYPAPFVFLDKGLVRCELGKFGLEPFWAKDKPQFQKDKFNARSETVESKNTYRTAWKERRFGLVIVEHFCEPLYFSETESKRAAISRIDGEPTAIATIWESYFDEKTEEYVRSFSMLTVNADNHPFMRQFHEPGKEKRSVVIVDNKDFDKWLGASHERAKELIKLPPDNYLEYEL